MAGGLHGLEDPVPDGHPLAVGQPLVGQGVVRHLLVGHLGGQQGGELVGQRGPARGPQGDLLGAHGDGAARHHLERVALARAEGHPRPGLAAQRRRLRVVVAVHVRDQEAPDVPQVRPEPAQRRDQDLPGLGERPPAVDERQPGAVAQHVDVDRPQRVGGEREGHPEHVGGDLLGLGAAPGVAVLGIGHAVQDAVPAPARRAPRVGDGRRRRVPPVDDGVRSNLRVRCVTDDP